MEWVVPLVISSVRLVVIFMLLVANVAALVRISTYPKYTRGSRVYELISFNTILCLNLIYLVVIWTPFTLLAFRHDLVNQHKDNVVDDNLQFSGLTDDGEGLQEFIVEYIDIRNDQVVAEETEELLRVARATQEMQNGFNVLPGLNSDLILKAISNYSSQPSKEPSSQETAEHSYGRWNTDIQDLETSSFAYSLALTGIFRLIVSRRTLWRPSRPLGLALGLALGSLILVMLPVLTTGLIRYIGKTAPHLALHKPEVTEAGYTIRNIICDVHITEAYVLSLFLEWAAVCTLAITALVLSFTLVPAKNKEGSDVHMEGSNCNVETLARDLVLVLGASWAWPLKPLLALILYCQYGPHWTNLVCFTGKCGGSNSRVFIPLAIFLSRPRKNVDQTPLVLLCLHEVVTEDVSVKDKPDVAVSREACNTVEKNSLKTISKCGIEGTCDLHIEIVDTE
nr:uncharacterized protein LOC128696184 [Cherax quadricarinatus]